MLIRRKYPRFCDECKHPCKDKDETFADVCHGFSRPWWSATLWAERIINWKMGG